MTNATPLKNPPNDPNNVEAKKYYTFNETGNIMMATTDMTDQQIQQSVRDVFAEVSVFFAAMTRAISTTPNPDDPGHNYSIYNYTALERVIDGSGLFVHVTEEDVEYKSSSFGVEFSKELIEALLGLATGAGEMSFASAMVASIGNEGVSISGNHTRTDSKVGNIVFVCEYLLGMPCVSAIVVYADLTLNKQSLHIGPCFKESSQSTTWKLHKDTYMFVTPKFIHTYASDLDSVESDVSYNQLVGFLQNALLQTPTVSGVMTTGTNPTKAPSTLTAGDTYAITGEFLGSKKGSLKFDKGTGATLNVTSWTPDEIQFQPSGASSTASAIGVYPQGGSKAIAETHDSYTVS